MMHLGQVSVHVRGIIYMYVATILNILRPKVNNCQAGSEIFLGQE